MLNAALMLVFWGFVFVMCTIMLCGSIGLLPT